MTPKKFPWHDPEMAEAKVQEAFAWWEWMRWIYNLAVLIAGVSALVLSMDLLTTEVIAWVMVYALAANGFYSVGFLAEMFDQHYFKSKIGLYRIRLLTFIVGTGFSMFITFFGGLTFLDPFWFDPAP